MIFATVSKCSDLHSLPSKHLDMSINLATSALFLEPYDAPYILDTLITSKGLKRSNSRFDELNGAEICRVKKQLASVK